MAKERIQKIISSAGIMSRRAAEKLIEQGKVTVNGRKTKLGDQADIYNDLVIADGEVVMPPEKKRYIMLHKPRGYVTTLKDEKGRKCVADLLPDVPERVYPVGRLDKNSEGLLLLTNDGNFANSITHPIKHVPKIYRVTLRSMPTEDQLAEFRRGIMLEGEKFKTAPAEIDVISTNEEDNKAADRVVVRVILREGRNRQIRRMFEHFGIEVARLKRTEIGSLKLGMLKSGSWKELSDLQIKSLMILSGATSQKGGKSSRGGSKGGSRDGSRGGKSKTGGKASRDGGYAKRGNKAERKAAGGTAQNGRYDKKGR